MSIDLEKTLAWFDSMIETIEESIKKAEVHIEQLERQQESLTMAVDALQLYDRFMSLPQQPSPSLPSSDPTVSEVIENA